MTTGKFTITKVVYKSNNFNIYGAIPVNQDESKFVFNQYNNITIKTEADLARDHTYTLTLKEDTDNFGVFYKITGTVFSSLDIDNMTEEKEMDILCEVTSETLAKNIHEVYPHFVQMILKGNKNEIHVDKIKGVGKKTLDKLTKKITKESSASIIRQHFPQFNLTTDECDSLVAQYKSVDSVLDKLEKTPYDLILSNTSMSFFSLDKKLGLTHHDTYDRLQWLVYTLVKANEYDGSTYTPIDEIYEAIQVYDPDALKFMDYVLDKSTYIHYDKDKSIIQTWASYKLERKIAYFMQGKLQNSTPLNWDWEQFKNIKDGVLTSDQQQALKMVCDNALSILVGFAGTGKSSTVSAILQMIEANSQSYTLLAPTGKAAQRLSHQTGRPASTIHRACGSNQPDKTIDTQWIIVDEMSMVSLDVFCMLIDAIKNPTARLLLIGDSGQLPSIGVGTVLRDCYKSGTIPTTILTYCFRFEEGGASYVGECMRRGQKYLPTPCPKTFVAGDKKDYAFLRWDGTVEQIINTYIQSIDNGIPAHNIALLVPYNKGKYGTLQINNAIQNYVNPISPHEETIKSKVDGVQINYHVGDIVLITKNDYKIGVFNGQTGVIKSFDDENITITIDAIDYLFPQKNRENLRLGYAMTVHKFQGSQAPYIINVIIPPHQQMLSRELCYTAQTRFSSQLIEIGTEEAINKALATSEQDTRVTRLEEFLNE